MSFPYVFPLTLGASHGDPEVDHVASGLSRVAEYLKDKPKFMALVEALLTPFNELEVAINEMKSLRTIDGSTGTQLDNIGAIVGQVRGDLDDDTYRIYIKARVKVNRSSGTIPQILEILRLVVPSDVTIKALESYPAGMEINLLGSVTAAEAVAYDDFARDAKMDGVRLNFTWTEDFDESTAFTLDGTPGQSLDAGYLASET